MQSKIFALWQCENPDAFSRLHRFCLSISRRLVVLPSSITPQKITASQLHPLKFTQTLRNYLSTSIQGTKKHCHFGPHPLELTLFKHIQRQTQAHSSSRHYHSTELFYHPGPHLFATFSKQRHSSSPSSGQTYQLTLCNVSKHRH